MGKINNVKPSSDALDLNEVGAKNSVNNINDTLAQDIADDNTVYQTEDVENFESEDNPDSDSNETAIVVVSSSSNLPSGKNSKKSNNEFVITSLMSGIDVTNNLRQDGFNFTNQTKNQIQAIAVHEYLDMFMTLDDDTRKFINVEFEVLETTINMYQVRNQIIDSKDRKWKLPDALSNAQIADILAKLYPIKRITCNAQCTDPEYDLLGLYIDDPKSKDFGIYVTEDEVIKRLINLYNYNMTERDWTEVSSLLRHKVPRVMREENKDLIAVNNGIFHYDTKELTDFSPDVVFLSKSNVNYNDKITLPIITMPDGVDWDIDSWIHDLFDTDPELENLIWEIMGAIIRPNVAWNKAAFFYSEVGNNGKGTLCELMRQLCGEAYCSIKLEDFGKDFLLEPLTRASAIIVDENDVGSYIDKAANVKAVITNDVIQINRKYKVPVAFQFKGFMVQCLNSYPKLKDKSDSLYRRQLFVPFTKSFTDCERKYIKADYMHRKDVLEYVLYKVLNMNYYQLSNPSKSQQTLSEYKEYNDPVRMFFMELEDEFAWNFLPFNFLYDMYKEWFKLNVPSGSCAGKINFINDLINVLQGNTQWMCEDKSKKYRVTKAMNMYAPEPLIKAYNMTTWFNPTYTGKDANKIGTPRLLDSYRGIIRIQNLKGTNTEETNN